MKRLLGLTACMLPLVSTAEFVVPVETVEDYVNIRMVPDAKSEVVGRLFQGDSAELVQSIPEWHEVEIAGGATGYISADWTRIVDERPTAVVRPRKPVAAAREVAAPGANEAVTAATIMPADAEARKANIAELSPEEALAALANLEPVTFSYTQEDQERFVGFVAENLPDLIASSESEGLKPLEIVAVLTRIVKLQQRQIAELESRLEPRN